MRERAGLTQEGLAERASLTGRTIRNLETGVGRPRGSTLLLLVAALELGAEQQQRLLDLARRSASQATTRAATAVGGVPAQLPLALAVVAARAATYPSFPLAALADELRQARGGLAGLPAGRVRPLLAELTRAHLVSQHAPGRYACHDLLRAYASELARAHDPGDAREAALHRVLDHYLHTAHRADQLLHPYRHAISLGEPQPGVTLEHLADHAAAMAWFTAEHQVLLAAVRYAASAGFDTHTWQLAWAMR